MVMDKLLAEIVEIELLDVDKSDEEIGVDDGLAFGVLICRNCAFESIAGVSVVDLEVEVPETFEFGEKLEVELVKIADENATSLSASELPVKSLRFSMVKLVMVVLPML